MNNQADGHLAETTREAFRALPAKQRASIFKRADPESRALHELIEAAHIPSSFQPARIAHWLTADQQRKLEELALAPENESCLQSLLRHFFCHAHKPLNDLLLSLIDPNGSKPQTFEQAFISVQEKFPQDPYLVLYIAATRWICQAAINALDELAANSTNFPELDKELQTVSAAVAGLQDIDPADVAHAVAALQRAQALTSSLVDELKSLATEANEPEPDWSSREEFVAHRVRLADLASSRNRMSERAGVLVDSLIKLLAATAVRHRLPTRSVALTQLAHTAANELTQHAADLKAIVMHHSGSALEWLKWLWQKEGVDAENLQQKLRPVSPALADLLAAPWSDFQWPTPNPSDAQSPPPAAPQTVLDPAPKPAPAPTQPPPPAPPHKPDVSAAAAAVTQPVQPKSESAPVSKPVSAAAPAALQPQLKTKQPDPPEPATVEAPSPSDQKSASPATDSVAEPAPALVPAEDRSPIATEVWRLALAERWGLASHLATLSSPGELPPPWLFEAAALSPRVNYEVSPISERLTELFMRSADFHVDSLQSEARAVARLLLATVALRPALLAPKTGAASLLKLSELTTVPKLLAVGQFVEAVAEFGLHRQALQPDMLLSSHNVADWERQLAQVRAEINQWLEQAPARGFNYAIAGRIWRKWTTHSGPMRHLLQETANAGPHQVEMLQRQWEPWSTRAAELVQSGIREFNHRMTMDGTARDKLIERIGEAVRLADRVLVLLSQTPQPAGTFRGEQVHQLLAARQRHFAVARRELKSLIATSQDDATVAAVRLCDEAFERIDDILQGHLPLPGGDEPNPRWILDAELLRDPVFQLSSDGTVMPPDPSLREPLLALAQTTPDWKAAWTRQIAAENHLGTAALLEFLRWQLPPGLDITAFERQRDQEIQTAQQRVQADAQDTRRLLDEFASLGLCREQDYNNWAAEVEAVEGAIPSIMEFRTLRNRLQNVRNSVASQRETEAARVRQQLDNTQDVAPEDRNRIAVLLTAGDIHTATDYLDLLCRKQPLPQPGSSPSIFLTFFGKDGWLPKAESRLLGPYPKECSQAALDGSTWNHLSFQSLTEEHRLNVETQLELWNALERKRQANQDDVDKLVSSLGLQPTKITPLQKRTGAHIVQSFAVQAQVLDERSSAVVPAFGSGTRGKYVLQLVWGEPSADELLNLCRREMGDTSANIILTFRLLTSKDRHELAEEARKPERTFKGVVVDRALYLFTSAQSTARFPTLLRCALPFSYVEPYSITAGEVPPEMFYGRGRELQSLADPRGSCFVYGGRQLGKTALLLALKRRFRNVEQGRVAIYVDLKRELFSRGRGIDALWSVLLTQLLEAGVLSESKVGASAGQEALFRHVKEWLAVNPDRRLLLLLDEADTFLEEDGKETGRYEPFPRCQRLKGLMEDTGRRFKVIFAGLHNVQRTTRSANHPLAHFGEAICIGPMLEEAESREARALVEQPLAAAGYFFQSPEVVSRILALSNYYPSLIQIFCHHLLADLRANHITRFPNPRSTPPCVITSQHVQTAYGSRVREQIDIKVGLTLDLDKRYKLIARLLAFYHANQPTDNGVPLRDIRADATEYWPAGFNEMRTDDEFRSLLEEMVGLGILRSIPDTSKFALRSQNVTTLLGNPDEIARQLDEAKDWQPALKYEADKFRRLLTERPKLTFSPLTAQQESELQAPENRVAILYGVPAAGLTSVHTAMVSDSMFGRSRTSVVRDCRDANSLSDRIANLDRKPQSNSIILVPSDLPWDESWVAAALSRLDTFKSKDAFLTVLFIADPLRTAATLQGLDGAPDLGIRQLTLRPWHDAAVRQWLEELGINDDQEETRKAILTATGNWPELLMRLNASSTKDLMQACEAIDSLFSDRAQLSQLRTAFGFDDPSAEYPLRIAAQLKEFTVEEVCDYAEAPDDEARQRIARHIAWADRLGLITLSGARLKTDPIVAKILLKSAETA